MILLTKLAKDLVRAYWWMIPILLGVAYLKTPSGKGLLGNHLVQRTLTTGARAGTSFVGCSTFPDCRYLRL